MTSPLFATHYLLNIIQLVECLYWCKIIYINIEYLVTNLTEYRVVKLEEAQLSS